MLEKAYNHEPVIMSLSPLKTLQRIINSGFTTSQAEAIMEHVHDIRSYEFSSLASKAQLNKTEAELKLCIKQAYNDSKSHIQHVAQDLAVFSQKTEDRFSAIDSRFDQMDQKMDRLHAESNEKMDRLHAESNEKMDRLHAESNEKMDRLHAESNEKMDRLHAESNAKMDRLHAESHKHANYLYTKADEKTDLIHSELLAKIDANQAYLLLTIDERFARFEAKIKTWALSYGLSFIGLSVTIILKLFLN